MKQQHENILGSLGLLIRRDHPHVDAGTTDGLSQNDLPTLSFTESQNIITSLCHMKH